MNNQNDAIKFLKWCNTPVYRSPYENELRFRLRVCAQLPNFDKYIVIDSNGRSIFDVYLTAEELYEYWLKNR